MRLRSTSALRLLFLLVLGLSTSLRPLHAQVAAGEITGVVQRSGRGGRSRRDHHRHRDTDESVSEWSCPPATASTPPPSLAPGEYRARCRARRLQTRAPRGHSPVDR